MYIYNATGQKLEKIVSQGTAVTSTNYLYGFQYSKPNAGVWALQFFPTAEGYVKNTIVSGVNNYSYVFNYTDHLGNVRLSYQDINKDGLIANSEILEESNYYPFGMKHSGYNSNNAQANYKYKYNGKELQDELGLNVTAMDFRQYDSAIGRFNCIDPLAEMKYDSTPFRFGFNNPNFWSDPSGLFETRKEAREYRREHHIKGGITKDSDGSFSINDKKNGVSYFKPEAGSDFVVDSEGVTKGVFVEAKSNNTVSTGKTANDYAGLVSTGLEAAPGSFRLTTATRGFSPKFYANAWTGNGSATTFNVSNLGKGLGIAGIIVGTALDTKGVMNYYNPKYGPNSPNSVHPAKAGTNLGMAAYGFYINPIPALL